jgi:hypothetical protein
MCDARRMSCALHHPGRPGGQGGVRVRTCGAGAGHSPSDHSARGAGTVGGAASFVQVEQQQQTIGSRSAGWATTVVH